MQVEKVSMSGERYNNGIWEKVLVYITLVEEGMIEFSSWDLVQGLGVLRKDFHLRVSKKDLERLVDVMRDE